jgi:hypothetical protein
MVSKFVFEFVLCRYATTPELWVPGGDIKVTHSVGDPALNTWSEVGLAQVDFS